LKGGIKIQPNLTSIYRGQCDIYRWDPYVWLKQYKTLFINSYIDRVAGNIYISCLIIVYFQPLRILQGNTKNSAKSSLHILMYSYMYWWHPHLSIQTYID
jgi:hypothetical protein